MKNKTILYIALPILALITALTLGGMYYAKADYGSDFTVAQGVLIKYNGTDAKVVLPDGITSIGREAFSENPLIETVVFSSMVKDIDYGAFANCNGLREIVIPDSVTSIADSAFCGCSNLSKVVFGKNVTDLGNGVFGGCNALKQIVVDQNPNFVCKDSALYNADMSVLYQYLAGSTNPQYDMPDSVSNIKRYAFWGCTNLEDIMVSAGLSSIPDYAFSNCIGVETIWIEPPVNSIGMKSFENCTSLIQISIPVSVGNIHETAFDGCKADLLIVCEKDSYVEQYAKNHNLPYSQVATYQVSYIEENANTYENDISNDSVATDSSTNPNDTQAPGNSNTSMEGEMLGGGTIVSDRVFLVVDHMNVQSGADLITNEATNSVSIPTISDYAFYRDESLTSYDFTDAGQEVEAIGRFSFARSGLTSVTIPEGITTISYGAFYHCDNLTDVTIPDSVTLIEAYAFEHTAWLENWRNTPSTGNASDDFLIVGDGVLIAYKGNDANVVIPSNVKTIADSVFRDHIEIASLQIPSSVQYIGAYAFNGCTHLVDIDADFSTITIETNSFSQKVK